MHTSLKLASLNQSFTAITSDSRNVKAGTLFLAYPGAKNDGRHYILQAIESGATAIIWEKEGFHWDANWQVRNVGISNLKQQVGRIAAEYYHYPSEQLTMIGVTGTNGKTSVSQWVAQCLASIGQKTAVLGTIGNGFVGAQSETLADAANTTPDAILLQGMLSDFVAQKADAVVMEVSSHGLEQGRVNGVVFDIAVLTNLTRDHLDYHVTMEAYAAAKQKLFAWEGLGFAILNADDAFGQTLADILKSQEKPYVTYGLETKNADIKGSNLQLHDAGLSMQVNTPQGVAQITAAVLGRFNAYNLLAVLATLLALDISLDDAVIAIAQIKPVLGRMQKFGGGALPLVVIDYAHTPDALEKVLTTLREQITPKKQDVPARLICVFGCGGDRDAGKRPLMGAIASKLADLVIVTSDNPRGEAPTAIANDIISGMSSGYMLEADRAVAIHQAI
ncbi:MAG TPA: UDP-N-acetylmuramoyl-L-alanyl-D-glutamate--2,6-diaminopimelate ligase, partial [Methylotenera sp.]|nr:UDP-N-acetylmuramoyl-L-alanyl-D-glutamate--2,6-diaminopimelate ligase [Methylotenera sp.]